MYIMKVKEYTVAEFRKNTREILNEASTGAVAIIRYGERFILTKAHAQPSTLHTTVNIPLDLNRMTEEVERRKREKLSGSVVKNTKLCKHGWPLGQCFDRKSDRSCKV
jgi:hypothetical protein